jgi:hypothetical protein
MKQKEVYQIVCAALVEVQTLSGRDSRLDSPAIKPIGDLDGFDSLCSVEATVIIESRLGIDLGLESLFISDDGLRPLTIEETCSKILERLNSGGASDGNTKRKTATR